MDRTRFILIAAIIVMTAAAAWIIKYRQPELEGVADWASLPLAKGEWVGEPEVVPQGVIDLLRPNSIFNANYFGSDGIQVNLFLGDWSEARGGPHSPMNCLPASGWTVEDSEARLVVQGDRQIEARRLHLRFNQVAYLMDFWYITPFGETSNDYRLKLNEMLTSLTLQPRHLAFVRFVAVDTEAGHSALDRFERDFIDEIYARLPENSE